uniref:Lipoprotein n=1 Tax=Panagrolaimus davidi TaxID=227884 RepID=A0A914P2B7_9BILA
MKSFLPLIFLAIIVTAYGCNIIVHVESKTAKKFKAEVTAPNNQKSSRWSFAKKEDRETFQQKASECGIGAWHIITYDDAGKQVSDVSVSLNGIGRVDYEVGDDLKPVQSYRQGAICTSGQCAPLGHTPKPASRPNSPTGAPKA